VESVAEDQGEEFLRTIVSWPHYLFMPTRFVADHPGENVFDSYALGRLLKPALAQFEEHLLLCELCQDRLGAVDALRFAVRLAESKSVKTRRLDFCHDTED
jgi:hypothetical protein